jgi:hypothetical protein
MRCLPLWREGQPGSGPCRLALACWVAWVAAACAAEPLPPQARPVFDAIGTLESRSDPKCHATASRLEDFIYGTPLTSEARMEKNRMLQGLVRAVWAKAAAGHSEDGGRLDSEAIAAAFGEVMKAEQAADGSWRLGFADGVERSVTARDFRHYGSVAYSLRAILAVNQADLLGADAKLPPLDDEAVAAFKQRLDLAVLGVLGEADRVARENDRHELAADDLTKAWRKLLPEHPGGPAGPAGKADPGTGWAMVEELIDRKISSYEAYNEIAHQLFVRNMQVYYARLSWPLDPREAKAFKGAFMEAVTGFATELLVDSAAQAGRDGRAATSERDVAEMLGRYLPHEVNEFEDVVFFPRLGRAERVVIEAYDLDSFRDSGVHWRYLGFALEDPRLKSLPAPDPFAAELLVENIAQFGVLLLRVAGIEGMRLERERLSSRLLVAAMERIQKSIDAHAGQPETRRDDDRLASAATDGAGDGSLFTEVGAGSGIEFMHRSSDWLNRQLRGYLKKDDSTGIITIPPAFGGSGVAAADIDADGLPDLLLLGGLGNRLYRNLGGGRFEDITARSGIDWVRPEDKRPGEPRQPLVADFDNDGHQDILITYVDDAHRLYRGLGGGRFEDLTDAARLGGEGMVGGPATTFDFDNDGLLDIYITYFGNYLAGVLPTLERRNSNGGVNRLFRNLGGMRFEDVTERAGVGDPGWAQAVTHTDIDGDGRQDLVVGNDFGINVYYRNLGDGRFEDVAAELGTDKPSYAMSIGVADLNRDLLPDFYISNIVTMNKDEKYVLPNADTRMKFNLEKLAHLRVVEANDLFLSSGGEGELPSYHLSRAVGRGHSSTGWAWDADFFDADNDGDDDLYVLNGMNEFNVYSSHNPYFMDPDDLEKRNLFLPVAPEEKNVFLVNREGRLHNDSERSGLDFSANSRSAAYLDADADGDLDILVLDYHGPARLFRNLLDDAARNWIAIDLEGDPGRGVNRDAIGARVIITPPGGRPIMREVHGSTGYMSVHPKRIHAGLGSATSADLTVIWPNGERTEFAGLPANRRHLLAHSNPGSGDGE